MKNILTVVATALITAGLLVGGNALINGGGEKEGRLSGLFSFGSESENENIIDNAKNTNIKQEVKEQPSNDEELVTCPENMNPVENPLSGEIECIAAETVDTQCLWIDGEAYDVNTKKTQYQVGLKTEEDLNPECESAEFVCKNGEFVSNKGTKDDYNRIECVIIDQTDEELITCEHNGNLYVPGEERYQFLKSKVEKTTECRYVGFFCNGNGERFSNFDENIYQWEECNFSDAMSDEYIEENLEELLKDGKVTKTEDNKLIQNDEFAIQSEGNEANCSTPRGDSVNHGESILSFEEKVQPFDDECVVRTSVCDDGEWDELDPFQFPTCKIDPPKNCDINGYTLHHDSTKEFYNDAERESGERVCESKVKYCRDGITHYNNKAGAVAPNEEYIYLSCQGPSTGGGQAATFNPENAVCPNPYVGGGSARSPDQTGIGYHVASVGFENSCSEQSASLVCKYGTIRTGSVSNYSGTVGKKFHRSCSEGSPASCLFNFLDTTDESVAHGGTTSYYSVSSVPYGQSCSNQYNASGTYCTNGSLSVASGYKNCVEKKPAACSSSCGSVAHGSSITTYTTASLPYGQGINSCNSVSNVAITSTCTDGNFNVAPASNCSCTVAAPVGCSNGMSHGQTITKHVNTGCNEQAQGNQLDGSEASSCQCVYGSVTCSNGNINATPNRSQVQNGTAGSC